MPSYILRNIDADLWERVKARSAEQGIPLRAIILALLELYAEGRVDVVSTIRAKVARGRP